MSSPPPAYLCRRCLLRLRSPQPSSASRSRLASPRTPLARAPTAPSRLGGTLRVSHRFLSSSRRLSQLTPHKLARTDPNLLPDASPPAPPAASASFRTALLHRPTPPPPEGCAGRAGPEEQRAEDEAGIHITPRATLRLQQIMRKEGNPLLCLRVSVESGGCHGFQYVMSLIDSAAVAEAEDYVFCALPCPSGGGAAEAAEAAEAGTGAWRRDTRGLAKVVMDAPSLELLRGSRVDYTMELIGSQFKVENPRASSSCGCGTSFDVKD